MPKNVQITVPPDQTDPLVAEIEKMQDPLNFSLQRGASRKPKGDTAAIGEGPVR